MKLNPNNSKAYAGGAGAGIGLLASFPVAEALTDLATYGLSFLGTVPPNVEAAINTLIMAGVTIAIAGITTYFAPPNEINPDGKVEAYVTELEAKAKKEGTGQPKNE